jgi:hypothetical protein
MKLRYFLLSICFLFYVSSLFCQTSHAKRLFIPFLDQGSQSNVVVTVSDLDGHGQPCPSKYTNILSNTNLFSVDEQKLLKEIPVKYINVTTNCGPSGTVLVDLNKTNGNWWAHFRYTNSEACDDIMFGTKISAKFRTKTDDGYDVDIFNSDKLENSTLFLRQIKHGMGDGLAVGLNGNHCNSWAHAIDGKAIGKWFMWNETGNLIIEAEFTKPYDVEKHIVPLNNGQ